MCNLSKNVTEVWKPKEKTFIQYLKYRYFLYMHLKMYAKEMEIKHEIIF